MINTVSFENLNVADIQKKSPDQKVAAGDFSSFFVLPTMLPPTNPQPVMGIAADRNETAELSTVSEGEPGDGRQGRFASVAPIFGSTMLTTGNPNADGVAPQTSSFSIDINARIRAESKDFGLAVLNSGRKVTGSERAVSAVEPSVPSGDFWAGQSTDRMRPIEKDFTLAITRNRRPILNWDPALIAETQHDMDRVGRPPVGNDLIEQSPGVADAIENAPAAGGNSADQIGLSEILQQQGWQTIGSASATLTTSEQPAVDQNAALRNSIDQIVLSDSKLPKSDLATITSTFSSSGAVKTTTPFTNTDPSVPSSPNITPLPPEATELTPGKVVLNADVVPNIADVRTQPNVSPMFPWPISAKLTEQGDQGVKPVSVGEPAAVIEKSQDPNGDRPARITPKPLGQALVFTKPAATGGVAAEPVVMNANSTGEPAAVIEKSQDPKGDRPARITPKPLEQVLLFTKPAAIGGTAAEPIVVNTNEINSTFAVIRPIVPKPTNGPVFAPKTVLTRDAVDQPILIGRNDTEPSVRTSGQIEISADMRSPVGEPNVNEISAWGPGPVTSPELPPTGAHDVRRSPTVTAEAPAGDVQASVLAQDSVPDAVNVPNFAADRSELTPGPVIVRELVNAATTNAEAKTAIPVAENSQVPPDVAFPARTAPRSTPEDAVIVNSTEAPPAKVEFSRPPGRPGKDVQEPKAMPQPLAEANDVKPAASETDRVIPVIGKPWVSRPVDSSISADDNVDDALVNDQIRQPGLASDFLQQAKVVVAVGAGAKAAPVFGDIKLPFEKGVDTDHALRSQVDPVSHPADNGKKADVQIKSDSTDRALKSQSADAQKSVESISDKSNVRSDDKDFTRPDAATPRDAREIRVQETTAGPRFQNFIDTGIKADESATIDTRIAELSAKLNQQVEPRVMQLSMAAALPGDKKVMKMRLNPAELGTVEITIEKSASGRISAVFHTENESTQRLLNDGLAHLRNSLENSGCQVGNLATSCNSTSANGSNGRDARPQNPGTAGEGSALVNDLEMNSTNEDDQQDRLVNLRA